MAGCASVSSTIFCDMPIYLSRAGNQAMLKYERYYPDHQTAKVFNDMLGLRTLCNSYGEMIDMAVLDKIRVADMTGGKTRDDGYRGVHVYFQMSSFHYLPFFKVMVCSP